MGAFFCSFEFQFGLSLAKERKDITQMYQEYGSLVYNLSLRYVQNKEDAEEITQDVFVKVYTSIKRFRNESSLKTWVYRITVNKSLDFLKSKNKVRKINTLSDSSMKMESGIEDQGIKPDKNLESKEEIARIQSCIDELPDQQKTAIILFSIEGLSKQEVCKIMGKKDSVFDSLLFRARNNLKKTLQKNGILQKK